MSIAERVWGSPPPRDCRATRLEMIGQGDNFLEFIFLLSPPYPTDLNLGYRFHIKPSLFYLRDILGKFPK